ncbi:MAG: helix-turn-helix transcriptional regulator, partial [Chthoniobacteraceae bacterium]
MQASRQKIFGQNLNRLRTGDDLTQEAFAEKADVDRSYVQRVEAEESAPGLDVICQFCEALGVEPNELMAGAFRRPVASANGGRAGRGGAGSIRPGNRAGRNGNGAHPTRGQQGRNGCGAGRADGSRAV